MDLYTILEIKKKKKWQERLGVPGAMPSVEKSHSLFFHLGLALYELQHCDTVASGFNLPKVPLRPQWNRRAVCLLEHTPLSGNVLWSFFLFLLSPETGSVVQAGLKSLSALLPWQPRHWDDERDLSCLAQWKFFNIEIPLKNWSVPLYYSGMHTLL